MCLFVSVSSVQGTQDDTSFAGSVAFISPDPGMAVFGPTLVKAEVDADLSGTVLELWLDGTHVGDLEPPDFELQFDFGDKNQEHVFEIKARTPLGSRSIARQTTPALRIDDEVELDLKQIFATVKNLRGQRVLGLRKGDFTVRDDGVEQRIVTLEAGDIPFSCVLLLDASLSMRGQQMEAVLRGARAFVEGMNSFDEARLLVFADRLLSASPFTRSPDELVAQVPAKQSNLGTSIHDHLFWGLRLLEGRLGRQVLLLLSDGQDVHSVLSMETVAEALEKAEILFYWIQIEDLSGARSGNRVFHSFLTAEEIVKESAKLRRAVRRSGGRILRVGKPQEIEKALDEVLRELREQYAIGYYPEPTASEARWHRLDVKVRGSGWRVETRAGYHGGGK